MCISVLDCDASVLQRDKVPQYPGTRLLCLLFMPLRDAASGRCRGFRELLQLTILRQANVHASALPLYACCGIGVYPIILNQISRSVCALFDLYQMTSGIDCHLKEK